MTISSKIIFLDIDGPLLSHRAKQHARNQPDHVLKRVPPLPEPIDRASMIAPRGAELIRYFDELAVQLLLKLLQGHDAKVVVSSSWQKAGLTNIKFILEENGISSTYLHADWRAESPGVDATRAEAINTWLNEAARRGENVNAYAALDDDPSITTLSGGVMVPYADGLRWCDFCSASAALGGGIIVSDIETNDGRLIAKVTKGALGEIPVISFGKRVHQLELGAVGDPLGPAPPGCIRLRTSPYQLVRVEGPLPI